MIPGPLSLRALILTPNGRDSAIASKILTEAGMPAVVCETLQGFIDELEAGAGLGLIAEEALRHCDLDRLGRWARDQPTWSDFPFIVLTFRTLSGDSPITAELTELLGNVSFVERPFHPTSLLSLARSAVRGRRRQYEARARIEALRQGQEQLRFAQEAGRIGTFELFPATGLLAVSSTFCRLWGLPETAEVPLSTLIDLLEPEDRGRIGFFPVVSETADRVVLGFDDWHLDFRVVVDVSALGADRQQVTTTTLVRTHNWIGRVYLALILPFHRVIVRTMLAQAGRP